MIFEVDFGAAQTGIGYRFYDKNGAYIGARITTGINPAPETGMYITDATVPSNAAGIYWDCSAPGVYASEDLAPPRQGATLASAGALLRTVPFRKVLDAIVRRNGLEPDWDSSPHGRAAAICDHINTRVRTAWTYWPFPETMMLEQRAFRPMWQNSVAYNAGDQVFYGAPASATWSSATAYNIGDLVFDPVTGNTYRSVQAANTNHAITVTAWWAVISPAYYSALVATISGQDPTNAAVWGPYTLTDKFIPLDTAVDTPIDQVFGLFADNPRVCQWPRPIDYRLSEMGIDIGGYCTGATVWVHFRTRPPEFTCVPHVAGKQYIAGDIVFWHATGECYKAIIAAPDSVDPSVEAEWVKMPMLEIFSRYATAGAYADCLLESDPTATDAALVSARNTKANIAAAEAESYLIAQVDRLVAQGQHSRYSLGPSRRYQRHHTPLDLTVAA